MPVTAVLQSGAGLVLLFFLPGYLTTKALFPEWRIRGAGALRRLVEVVTLSFVLSVAYTVLIGYLLLASAPGGFQAAWSDPLLEAALAGVAVVGLGVALARGALARVPPPRAFVSEPAPGEEGALELTRQLDALGRETRRIRHALRAAPATGSEQERLRARLGEIERESTDLRARREAQYGE